MIRNFGHFTFIVYLCLVALIPFTDHHAKDVSPTNATFDIGHSLEHLPFSSAMQCCEIHESDHTNSFDQHIHFLLDDQGRATRHTLTDTSLAPQVLAAFDEVHFNHSLYEDIDVVVLSADFYQEALRPYSSGLSPPIV